MTCAVRYHSRTGNTKKVATAIAEAVGTEAHDCNTPLQEPVDLLFLGGAVYAGGIHETLQAYIAALKPDIIKQVALFSTTAIKPTAYPQIRKLLEERGIKVLEEQFHCWGKLTVLHLGKPGERDLAAAATFARSLLK